MTRVRTLTLLFLTLLVLISPFAAQTVRAQGTVTAASCNRSDVNAVINGPTHTATDGDTIIIPAGTCTWTSSVTINVGITVKGTGTPNTGGSTMGAGASTTSLVDSIGGPFFIIGNLTFGKTAKVEQMNMAPVSGAGSNSITGAIQVTGTCNPSGCPQVRVDNINFAANQWETPLSYGFILLDNVFGVVDHNTAKESTSGSPALVQVSFSGWKGIGLFGDNSFASADTFGTAQTLFIENNFLDGVRGSENDWFGSNGGGGARYACRFNTVTNMSGTGVCSAHGTAWSGRARGQRQVEVYYNTVSANTCDSITGLNSGVGYFFSNSVSYPGGGCNKFVSLGIPRFIKTASPWGSCNGSTAWDQAPFSSTSQCLDQPGRGVGSLMQNLSPVMALAAGTPCTVSGQCWPNPALDPVYEAGDVMAAGGLGSPIVVASDGSFARILPNRDYYAEVSQSAQSSSTSPFDGTTGTGHGLLARRPTTCTTGVGYWATDQGNWNQSGGGQGQLFVCASTNTWALKYTPYTYPHPLTVGSPGTPGVSLNPPVNLALTVQ
jgi:hypothetical protein